MSSLRRILQGLGAAAILLLVAVVLPAALIGTGHYPHTLPTAHQLKTAVTTHDQGDLLVTVLYAGIWACWALFIAGLLPELLAVLTHRPAIRIPGLSISQGAAASLILAIGLGGSITAAFDNAPSAHADTPTPVRPAAVATATISAQTGTVELATAPTVSHTVRGGETLWSIARDHLGDPRRYHEIKALNPRIGESNEIHPDQILQLPATTTAADTGSYTVRGGDTLWTIARDHLGDPRRYHEIQQLNPGVIGANDLIRPDTVLTLPGTPVPRVTSTVPAAPQTTAPTAPTVPTAPVTPPIASTPATAPAATPLPATPAPTPAPATPEPTTAPVTAATAATPAHTGSDEDRNVLRTPLGIGGTLAAGLVLLLGAGRLIQHRRRPHGGHIPLPTPAALELEQQLREVSDPLTAEIVDRALRTLTYQQHHTQQPLPVVRAARLTDDQFDLYLAEAAQLPAPWIATDSNRTVWSLLTDSDQILPGDAAAQWGSPYPSLVTIGHDDEDGQVLLDLEHLGALAITGPADRTREVLAAIATELATSTWADDLRITIVGDFPDLPAIVATGRLSYAPTVDAVLPGLLHRTQQAQGQLAGSGLDDLFTARAAGQAPALHTPEIVLIATDLTDQQRHDLLTIATSHPRVAVAAVTSLTDALTDWALTLHTDDLDLATLSPTNVVIRPQRIADADYQHLRDALTTAQLDPTPGPIHYPHTPDPLDVPEPVAEPIPTASSTVVHEEVQPLVDVDEPAATESGFVDQADEVTETATSADPVSAAPPVVTSASAAVLNSDLRRLIPSDSFDDEAEGETTTNAQPEAAAPTQIDEEPATTAAAEQAPMATGVEAEPEPIDSPAADTSDEQLPAPRLILLAGEPTLVNAHGPVEASKVSALVELAAYIHLHPGTSAYGLERALWPTAAEEGRLTSNTRNTAMSKLGKYLGEDPEGNKYMPAWSDSDGYQLGDQISSDWADFQALVGDDPTTAPTSNLEHALALVQDVPFGPGPKRKHRGSDKRRYYWTDVEPMTDLIVDAAYALAHRRLMEGRPLAADAAAEKGLIVLPARESLWRIRIVAAHSRGDQETIRQHITRITDLIDALDSDLEPETEELIEQATNPATAHDMAAAR